MSEVSNNSSASASNSANEGKSDEITKKKFESLLATMMASRAMFQFSESQQQLRQELEEMEQE